MILVSMSLFSIQGPAVLAAGETVKVVQVGTSGGIPAIQASVQNAQNAGTYSLVITNPKTNTTFSQELNSSGKGVTFAITNFTENGTYPYTLQVNGLELLEGGVNLVSTKRTPAFTVQVSGTDLTIDVTGGIDYAGQTIFFKSGSYSNSLVLSGDAIQRAFADAKGLNSKMTFSTEKGDLVTVDIKNISGGNKDPNTGGTKPPAGSGNNAGSVTTPPNSNSNGEGSGNTNTGTKPGGSITTPNIQPKPGASGGSTAGSSMSKNITISLNQKSFKLEETLVATVNVVNSEYAGRSITIRLGADDNSTVALLDLDNSGKGSSTFKILIPQPSSKVITATAYSISGTQLDSNSVNYTISNEVDGSGTKEDGDFDADTPYAKYVSLDLSNLDKQKATLAWYEGRNLSKYKTKVKVINTTTGDEHSYAVFMPDGDSKIDMNLVYDGPGIYTWELHSGGKLVAQAPYSTPLGIDGASAVSQNGLPVLKTLANKSVYLTNLEGIDPNGVNGATIGEPIGAVTADDITGQEVEEPFNPQVAESNKKRNMLIGLAVFLLLGCITAFILLRRKHNREDAEEESTGFIAYKEDEEDETISGDTSKFEEVD